MKYRLDGTTMQMLNCELQKGERMVAEFLPSQNGKNTLAAAVLAGVLSRR